MVTEPAALFRQNVSENFNCILNTEVVYIMCLKLKFQRRWFFKDSQLNKRFNFFGLCFVFFCTNMKW